MPGPDYIFYKPVPRPRCGADITMGDDVQKPVGPFEDFEACVRHFDDDEQVDDPEALCGWMEENKEAEAVQQYAPDEGDVESLVDAMKDPNASSVLTNLEVSYVSGVENPAQDSQWVMAKDADAHDADWGVTAPIVLHAGTQTVETEAGARAPLWSKDGEEEGEAEEAERQKAWAPVLIPNETDKQGDVIPPESIEDAAHKFLAEFRNIDTDHDLLEGKGVPIESWTLKEARSFTLPDGSESREYPDGTWMLGVKFSDESWERIKSGDLTGFSIYGEAESHDVDDILGGEVDLSIGEKRAAGNTGESMKNQEDPEKGLGTDELGMMAEFMRQYFDEAGGAVEEASLQQFVEWAAETPTEELDDTVEIAGVEIPIRQPDEGEEGEEEDGDGEPPEQEEAEMEESSGKDADREETEEENMKNEDGEGEAEAEEAEADPSVKEMLEDVQDTVKSTQQSVESHSERLEALEDEVFEKEDEGEPEGEAEAADVPDADEVADKAVAKMAGMEESELPDDPEERQEIVRKHLHENLEKDQNSAGNPEEWNEDDVSEVIR